MDDVLTWRGWVLLIIAACWIGLGLALSFIPHYHWRTDGAWHRTPEGRWTLYRRAMESSILGLTLINYYFPAWPGMLPVSFVVMALYAGQTYVPHMLLSRAHRDHEHEKIGAHRK